MTLQTAEEAFPDTGWQIHHDPEMEYKRAPGGWLVKHVWRESVGDSDGTWREVVQSHITYVPGVAVLREGNVRAANMEAELSSLRRRTGSEPITDEQLRAIFGPGGCFNPESPLGSVDQLRSWGRPLAARIDYEVGRGQQLEASLGQLQKWVEQAWKEIGTLATDTNIAQAVGTLARRVREAERQHGDAAAANTHLIMRIDQLEVKNEREALRSREHQKQVADLEAEAEEHRAERRRWGEAGEGARLRIAELEAEKRSWAAVLEDLGFDGETPHEAVRSSLQEMRSWEDRMADMQAELDERTAEVSRIEKRDQRLSDLLRSASSHIPDGHDLIGEIREVFRD